MASNSVRHEILVGVEHLGNSTVIFKEVPAEVCASCGEHYLSDNVSARLIELAEAAVASGAEIEIRRFAA